MESECKLNHLEPNELNIFRSKSLQTDVTSYFPTKSVEWLALRIAEVLGDLSEVHQPSYTQVNLKMNDSEYQDPDYPASGGAEIPHSSAERSVKLERAKVIVKREIQAELACREREVSTIDQRMWLARRTLHHLRSALLQQHYGTAPRHDDASRDHRARGQASMILHNKQTRLHPSQRRLTSKHIVDRDEIFRKYHGEHASDKRQNSTTAEEDPATSCRSVPPRIVKIETVAATSEDEIHRKPKKIPRHIEPESSTKVVTLYQSSRSRQKHKYRIIIGNTSKYSPPSSKVDRCSHKWLLYVRAPHGDISSIVRGVTVRLHQSYAPHHVVCLSSPPYHVCRRGWGEFPASVQLQFALPDINRPAVVEHTVKLDRRHTGMQSLGAETIVDVWLYSDQEMLKYAIKDDATSNEKEAKNQNEENDHWSDFFATDTTELDIDEMIIKPVKKTAENDNFEINQEKYDFSPVEIKEEPLDTDLDEFDTNMDIDNQVDFEMQQENIDGRTNSTDSRKSIERSDVSKHKQIDDTTNNIEVERRLDRRKMDEKVQFAKTNGVRFYDNEYVHIQNDHCYIPSEQMLPVLENGKKHRFDLGEVVSKMICVRTAVNFLLGKIPLVSKNACIYKNMFPFVVRDEATYWTLSDTRRRYAEWSRAKIVNEILTKYFPVKSSIWRTKQILYFARLHGYHPSRSKPIDNYDNHETQWELHKNLRKLYPTASDINSGSVFDETNFSANTDYVQCEPVELPCDSDDEIDVTDVAEEKRESVSPVKKKLEVLPIEDNDEKLRCFFIEKTCQDIGIELRNEDVGNGFSHSAVHRVMLSAVRCLISELLRTSVAETQLQDQVQRLWNINSDRSVGIQHVFSALRRHKRLRMFTMEGLYATPTEYNELL